MKTIGYLIFSAFYYLFRLCRIQDNKVFCIMTHDSSADSSVGVVIQALKESNRDYNFIYIRKQEREFVKKVSGMRTILSFFVRKPYHLATSGYILQDNIFLPMAFIRFPKKVKVVQLWHGTGTIKKFGQSVNTGKLKELERRANQTITHLIVNSDYTKEQYREAFGICAENIYVLGLPRTDVLFDMKKMKQSLYNFYQEFPDLMGKRIFIYAPTFRDDETDKPKMMLDIKAFEKELPENTVLLLKLHPHVAEAYIESDWGIINNEKVINVSLYTDVNTLLFAADALITDYSSIIFEYCLLERPMYFYSYDLDEFDKNGRGFYEEYRAYIPGPLSHNTMELLDQIKNHTFEKEKIRHFIKTSYSYRDGKSTKRLLETVFHIK